MRNLLEIKLFIERLLDERSVMFMGKDWMVVWVFIRILYIGVGEIYKFCILYL